MIMRLSRLLFGPFRWLVLSLLCVVCCGGVAGAQVTTFTGTVYSPLGAPPTGTGDPIPNILVFVVAPGYPPPVFTPGLTIPTGTQTGCEAQPDLVPKLVLGQALTDAAGKFTFTTSGPLPNPVTVVIQAGKWRQQYNYTNITAGETTPPLLLSMPATKGLLADLPHIAVVTGASDGIECIFQQIGILPQEISDPGGIGSINLFQGATGPGQYYSSKMGTPTETDLVGPGNSATLYSYDVVIFGCQGKPTDSAATAANLQAMEAYTNTGGRMFATHYGYLWLDNNAIPDFQGAATWALGAYQALSDTAEYAATIDTSYPEGQILDAWMTNIGALYNNTPHTIALQEVRVDTSGVNGPPPAGPAQSWVKLNPLSTQTDVSKTPTYVGTPSMQFTFDTPVGGQGTPTVAIAYTNSTKTFLQGDIGDSVTINVTNNSPTPTTAGLTLTIAMPGGLTATSLSGSNPTGWACNLQTLICKNSAIAAGASDPVTLTFNIASNAQVGQETLTAGLSGGSLSSSGQCGRVLFNDYHVEQVSANVRYPAECKGGLTTQEKFLEFSLYNLSNFVAPTTTDTIEIQGPVTLTWPQPAAILYGTALTSTQLDATAVDPQSGATVAGTFVYTPAAGTVPAVGNVTLFVAFTPTDTTDYASATGNVILEVDKDPTTTTLVTALGSTTPGAVTPIYYGQIIADTAVMAVTSNNPAVGIDGGSMLFYINGTQQCDIPITTMNCPATTGAGYNAGSYIVYSAYSGDDNFLPSQSPPYQVVVLPDPTSTAITSSVPTMTPGQSITFTANVTDTYYSPVSGTITFYDGTAPLGTVPATANAAVFSTSNLLIGAHSIKACFTSAIIPPNIQNFVNSCSTPLLETISLPPSVDPTVTVLTSSLNPSVVGQSVTFTATAATTGAFIGVPTGSVNFYDGGNSIGSGILTNGVATLTTSTLAAGLHQITAAYLGSTTMAPSTSAAVAQQVNTSLASAGTGFLMSVSPTTFSVGLGSSTSVVVSILELNNFNQPVTLSCSGLPAEATCIFATPTIPATGGSTPLTVTVSAPHNCTTTASLGSNTYLSIFAAVVLAFFARRRRVLKGLLLAAVLCILPAISGCSSCTDLGVKPGTYTFTVVGTAGSGGVTPVAVPSGGSSATPSTTTQSQTMTMTVVI